MTFTKFFPLSHSIWNRNFGSLYLTNQSWYSYENFCTGILQNCPQLFKNDLWPQRSLNVRKKLFKVWPLRNFFPLSHSIWNRNFGSLYLTNQSWYSYENCCTCISQNCPQFSKNDLWHQRSLNVRKKLFKVWPLRNFFPLSHSIWNRNFGSLYLTNQSWHSYENFCTCISQNCPQLSKNDLWPQRSLKSRKQLSKVWPLRVI